MVMSSAAEKTPHSCPRLGPYRVTQQPLGCANSLQTSETGCMEVSRCRFCPNNMCTNRARMEDMDGRISSRIDGRSVRYGHGVQRSRIVAMYGNKPSFIRPNSRAVSAAYLTPSGNTVRWGERREPSYLVLKGVIGQWSAPASGDVFQWSMNWTNLMNEYLVSLLL